MPRLRAIVFLAFLTTFPLVLTGFLSTAHGADRTLVFAAASMKDAVESIVHSYRETTGKAVTVSFAGSGTLARQIEAGAPADIFISANPAWMGYLAERGLVDPQSVSTVAGNTLVVVAGGMQKNILSERELAGRLGSERFSMGDPAHVPAGIYARQALEHLGLWREVMQQAAFAENVRVALAMAARGDVSHAIVYGSDARMGKNLEIVYRFSDDTHEPIIYPIALTRTAGPQAKAFYDFFKAAAAAGGLASYGFTRPSSDD